METVETKQLDEKDIEFIDIISRYGFTENEAKVFVCIKSAEYVTQKEIMQYTNLNQSQISVAVNRLIEKEYIWIAKSERRMEGKGRPSSTYSLHKSIDDIIGDIEKNTMQQIEDTKESIQRLKEYRMENFKYHDE